MMPLPLLLAAALAAPAAPDSAASDTLARVVPLPAVEVSTSRIAPRTPVAVTTLGRDAIHALDWGQDTPMAFATLPGAYAYSDAGNGIGYSYLSIRGFPQRRISVLVNGVPLNDPESHEVYWIDHPDLLASTTVVQLERGVGSALYGAAALGGSVDLETAPFADRPTFTATAGAGSYATRRTVLEGSSGPLAGGWNLYGRYARIESDGYRDQSDTRLWSYALSARRTAGAHTLRVNLYGGPEETHLAYLGVPASVLDGGLTGDPDRDRRFNPLTYPGERDHFFEPHYELIHTWAPRPTFAFTQTLFWFDGQGYYDERRTGQALADYRLPDIATTDTTLYPRAYYALDGNGNLVRDAQGRALLERFDVVRRRDILDRHLGWLPRVRLAHAAGALTVGGEIRYHDGHHLGSVLAGDPIPPGTASPSPYYDFMGRTLAAGVYGREVWDAARTLRVTADLAWRHEGYRIADDRFDGVRFDQHYDFALPRLGFTWTPRPGASAYASYAYASREPALRDLYDGEGVGGVPLYHGAASGVYAGPLVRPEHVHDVELGAAWHGRAANAGVDVFRMDFRDELVDAGQFDTDLGYPILGNAARSVHQGVELSLDGTRPLGALRGTLGGNATLSDNHFVRYTEHDGPGPQDVTVFDGHTIGFFPNVLANLSATLAWRAASVRAELQHVGRIYVDNSQSLANSVGPHTLLNLVAGLAGPVAGANVRADVRVMNLTNRRYATSGYMDYDANGSLVPFFMPAATRNAIAELSLGW